MVHHTRHQEPSMDRTIRPGDVAIDMAQGTWVYVVALAAPEVAVWNRENDANILDYAGNWMTGATLGHRVFTCVYLSGSGVKSDPSQSYDFPESRLARYPVEEANVDLVRPQALTIEWLLEGLIEEAMLRDHSDRYDQEDLTETITELVERELKTKPLDFPDADRILEEAKTEAIDRANQQIEHREEMDKLRAERAEEDQEDQEEKEESEE